MQTFYWPGTPILDSEVFPELRSRAASRAAGGLRMETVFTWSADYPATTNSITVTDFLGRALSVSAPAQGSPAVTEYVWGDDLSETRQGAGGACYKMTCKVNWTATVYLNTAIKGDKKKLMGSYGHEQRHVKAVWDNVESEIIRPLMGKKGFFENQKSCADAGIEYKKYFLEILTNLTNHKMERHGTGGHPERHKLYDPLPGSVWQGPSW